MDPDRLESPVKPSQARFSGQNGSPPRTTGDRFLLAQSVPDRSNADSLPPHPANGDYSAGMVAVMAIDEYQAERSEMSSSDNWLAMIDMISCWRLPDRKALSWVCK